MKDDNIWQVIVDVESTLECQIWTWSENEMGTGDPKTAIHCLLYFTLPPNSNVSQNRGFGGMYVSMYLICQMQTTDKATTKTAYTVAGQQGTACTDNCPRWKNTNITSIFRIRTVPIVHYNQSICRYTVCRSSWYLAWKSIVIVSCHKPL